MANIFASTKTPLLTFTKSGGGYAYIRGHTESGSVEYGMHMRDFKVLNGDNLDNVFVAVFKNIPNEKNDFAGYYAIAIGKDIHISNHSSMYVMTDEFELTTDGKSVRVSVEKILSSEGEILTPIDGFYMGEVEYTVKPGTPGQPHISWGNTDEGTLGFYSVYNIVDEIFRRWNQTVEHSFELSNEDETFKINMPGDNIYKLEECDGISALSQRLSTITSANSDGDTITSSKAEPREVRFEFSLNPKYIDSAIDALTAELYNKNCKIKWKTKRLFDDWYSKEWTLEGICNEISAPRVTDKVSCELNIHCPSPFWKGKTVVKDLPKNAGEFTASFGAEGDIYQTNIFPLRTKTQPTGLKIRIYSDGAITGDYFWRKVNELKDFEIITNNYLNPALMTGKQMLQKMKFNGTFSKHTALSEEFMPDYTEEFDVEISTLFKNKFAKDKINNVNMLNNLDRVSSFFEIDARVDEIEFVNVLFNASSTFVPHVVIEYTPLYI